MNFALSVKAKEAIKTGLAFVLVFGIALNLGWLNPYWAGWAVAMISLATIGESLNKGLLRIAGTIPGCIAALLIMSIAPQDRWGFVALSCVWIFFTTYMMIVDKQRAYFWNVAGFVCLVIGMTGPSSSETMFEHAAFRTIETAMGVLVYTLVSVFLWPRNNAGAIRKAGSDLVTTQSALIEACYRSINSNQTKENLSQLHSQQVSQFTALGGALQAEGSESYEVKEVRYLWDRFYGVSGKLMEAIDCWGTGLSDLPEMDLNTVFPDLPAVFNEFDLRFAEIQKVLDGNSSAKQIARIKIDPDPAALQNLSANDLASFAVFKKELEAIEALIHSMLECVQEIEMGSSSLEQEEEQLQHEKKSGFDLPVIDLDHLKGAGFAAFALLCGFLVYIYIDPPGHVGWYQFPATVAMAVGAAQQLSVSGLARSIGLLSLLCLGAYVFIMPSLSTFFGLGCLLFTLMFINCYFFTGMARLAGMIAILNEISVQSTQSYNFAAMANSLLFTMLAFVLVILLSYLVNTTRPEKALLKLIQRYFRSVDYIEHGHMSFDPAGSSLINRWRFNFHRYEIKTIPAKISAWGRFIDMKLFPGNSQEQIKTLVTSLNVLSLRIESLLDEGDGCIADLRKQLADIKPDSEVYYRLVGGLRGYSEASAAYEKVADDIDWALWREERFS